MARDELRIDVTADTSKAESDLKGLDRLADQIDLDPKVDTSGIDNASGSMADMADSAGLLPGPLGMAAGMLSGPAGIAAGAVAGAAGLYHMASSTADAALEAAALQAAVGGTVEESSRLLAATGSVGLEYNDLLELIAESNKAISGNADEAKRLGVNLSGTPIERFQELVGAVYQIEDPLERAATASRFFGEEGSKQLPRLIGLYGDLSSAMDAVPEGAVMSEEDVAAAREFKLATTELKASLGEFVNTVGKELLPVLTDLVNGMNTAGDAASWVQRQFDKLEGLGPGEVTAEEWETTGKAMFGVADDVDTLATSSAALGDVMSGGLADGMSAVTEGMGFVIETMGEAADATDKARDSNEKLRDQLFDTADAQVEAGRAWSDMNDQVSEFGKLATPTRADVERLNDSVFDYADAQVEAAGTTKDTTEGSKLYKDALRVAAGVLGDKMNPELQTFIDKALAVPDTAVTDVTAQLDPAEFDEADRLADALDQRTVEVQVKANITAAQRAISGLASSMFGARAGAAANARNNYRNGSG